MQFFFTDGLGVSHYQSAGFDCRFQVVSHRVARTVACISLLINSDISVFRFACRRELSFIPLRVWSQHAGYGFS
jgi:hypothetical protein